MFYLWRRMKEEDRARLWHLYGWFSGLMACGSCFGAVAWSAQMMFRVNYFKGDIELDITPASADAAQKMSLLRLVALSRSWLPAFYVTSAIEFMCMCVAKLMVLDRMLVFAAPADAKRWGAVGRGVMVVVVLGNAVGLAANAVAAACYQKAAEAYSTAFAFYSFNKTEDGNEFRLRGREEDQRAASIASVQSFCEVAVLLLLVAAFAAVGVLCARILNTRLKPIGVDAGYDAFMATVGRTLRRHMLGTTAFIFVTFLLRSVYSTMHAVVYELRDVDNKKCPVGTSRCDSSCYNVYTHMANWLFCTPEFQLMIVLISSPLALLVALWGMTTKSMLQLMKLSKRDKAMTLALMQPKKEEQPSMP
jgi:hypothetical protein